MPYHIRRGRESDLGFVCSTFVLSFCESAMVSNAGSGMWATEAKRVLEALGHEGSVLHVAAYDGDDDTLAGWSLGNAARRSLDYVYVRSELRRHEMPGSTLARELVEAIGAPIERVTFKPPKGRVKIPRGVTFAPRFTIGWAP